MEQFYAHHFIRIVVVEHHARRNFLGLDDGGFVEPEIKRIGFFIDGEFHELPFEPEAPEDEGGGDSPCSAAFLMDCKSTTCRLSVRSLLWR